jgi:hypothetical protein
MGHHEFEYCTLMFILFLGVGVPKCASQPGAYRESHQLATVLVCIGIWLCSHPSLHSLHILSFCVLLQLQYVSLYFPDRIRNENENNVLASDEVNILHVKHCSGSTPALKPRQIQFSALMPFIPRDFHGFPRFFHAALIH